MISDNPTKTRGIEKRWRADINRRYRLFYKRVIKALRDLDQTGLIVNAFDLDPVQLRVYIAYFQQQIDELLGGDWQDAYQLSAYELAITRAMAELRRSGARLDITASDRELASRISSFTATSSLGISAVDIASAPIHQETLEFLFSRSFNSLAGFNNTMSNQVRNLLFQGVEQGSGIRQIERQIKDRVNVARSRARLIAQTETIQAYQRGTINQALLASQQLGEEVKLRWLTRRDIKVRALHVDFHGEIMTDKQARRNISISPYNCRCGLSVIIKESDTPEKTEKFKTEQKELRSLTP